MQRQDAERNVQLRVLLLKILIAPVLIALVSLAGRKWGPGISGWLLGIPFNSGPILFFVALEQGPQFASRTAVGGLLGILAWAAFTIVYAHACLKLRWWLSTLIGWIAYFVVAALLLPARNLSAVPAFLLVCVTLALALSFFPEVPEPRVQTSYHRYDLWLRMATATFMVVSLTGFARLLGPTASGILSAFPAYTTILAVFNHHHDAASAVHVLKGVAIGLYTAATFFLILSPSLLRLGLAGAFALAVLGGLMVQATSLVHLRRRSAQKA